MNGRNVLALMLLIAGITVSSAAFAGACDIDSCTGPVQMVYVNATGPIYVQLKITTTDTSTLNCSLVSGVYFTLNPTSMPNFSSMYATLLAAAHAGRAVHLRATDNSSGCSLTYLTESF